MNTRRATLLRWTKFNLVGALGVAVQLAVLYALIYQLRLSYLAATFVAVECTIVHNFLWHERFTWADRRDRTALARSARWLHFNLTNGAVSLFGNLLLMHLLVDQTHLPVLLANGIAILFCSLVNFFVGDQFVFRPALVKA